MGNVMCCCRGRDKPLDDGKADQSEGGMNSKNVIKGKTPGKALNDDSSFSDNSSIGGVSAGGVNRPDVDRNLIQGARSGAHDNKHLSNFSTFGGGVAEGVMLEDLSTNKNQSDQPKRPGRPGTKSPNDSVNGPSNLINIDSNKGGNIGNLDTLADLTTAINTKIVKSSGKKVHFRISIDNIDILYKLCDDFGISFRPFIEIKIEGHETTKIYPTNSTDGDLDKSLNTSCISEMDNSMNLNMSQNLRTVNSGLSLVGIGKEKSYPFKFVKCFEISADNFYTNIIITIKNDIPGSNSTNNLNSSTTTLSTTNTSSSSNLPLLIIIGETKIPINLFYKHHKDNPFDGNLEIKLRNYSLVGYIKVNVAVSDKSLIGQKEFLDSMQNAKFLDVNDDDNHVKILDNLSSQSQKIHLNLYEHTFVNFEDMNPETVEKFFMLGNEKRDIVFDLAKRVIELSTSPIPKEFYRLFSEAIKTENLTAIYQILGLFVKLSAKDDFKLIGEFYKLLNDNDKNSIIDICKNCNENPYIIKQYIIFFHNYMRYFKNNKSLTIRNTKEIEDEKLIKNVIEVISKMTERVKNTYNSPEVQDEIKDGLIWSLNLLNEMIAQPVDLISKMSKDELQEQKIIEYTAIYENCIQIISKRIYILRIIDIYLGDSQIIGQIFKIFRKIVQVLTNDSSSLLDLSKLNLHPKDFAAKFRKLIIEQNEGIYFTTLKIMLSKYLHYPELHVNILIIIYQLTNYCDSQSLIWAAEKLNLSIFRDVFDIYRGRLRNFNRLLNSLHLNILANFSDIIKGTYDSSYSALMKFITLDIKSFYKMNPTYKRRLDDFRIKKKIEFEIHDIITRIGVNITKYEENSQLLMESFFFDDIIEFLIIIGVGEQADSDVNNSNIGTPYSTGDFILRMKERKKKMNLEQIKKIVYSIVENSVKIIVNVMDSPEEISEPFTSKLAEHEINSADDLYDLIDECKNLLLKYGIKIDGIDAQLEILHKIFE